jgi:hypothetical protein
LIFVFRPAMEVSDAYVCAGMCCASPRHPHMFCIAAFFADSCNKSEEGLMRFFPFLVVVAWLFLRGDRRSSARGREIALRTGSYTKEKRTEKKENSDTDLKR